MKSRIKFFAAIALFVIACVLCLFIFLRPNDKDNKGYVVLTGYVHDKLTGQPVSNCRVAVFNCIVQEDGGYGRDKILYTKTDADGFYEMEIENSYLMYVRVYKKGYAIARSGSIYSLSETEQNFALEKGDASEDDLYKEAEVSEVIK